MDANRQAVLDALRAMGVDFALHEHAPVHTIADCLSVQAIDWNVTEIPKNVFLCNRQKTDFFLMLLRHEVAFRTAIVSRALNVSRLSFAPDTALPGLLGLEAGAVSPLGLLFDRQKKVNLVMDEGLRGFTFLAFHPCDNRATLVLRAADFYDVFLKKLGRSIRWVKASEA